MSTTAAIRARLRTMEKNAAAITLAFAGTVVFCTSPARSSEPAPVVTNHEVRINGHALRYKAEVGRIPIRDVETDQPHAYMFYTAYRIPATGKPRPVIFLWGGGPGGWSLNMNFEVAGPLRADGPHISDGSKLIPNPQTLLTDTDIVIVDAVGTGYSRPTSREFAREFENSIADTYAFADFVRAWRLLHAAEDAPVYVGGISWGAPRAAAVSYLLLDWKIPLRGTVLVTGESSLNNRDTYVPALRFEALRVVGMAEVAFFHKRIASQTGATREAVSDAAHAWVDAVYYPALQRRERLNPSERNAIVAKLAFFTGVPLEKIDRNTLIVTPAQFRRDLLGNGKTLYGSDVRRTDIYEANYIDAALQHIRYDLGYETDLTYRSSLQTPEIGYTPDGRYPEPMMARWNFATSPVPSEEAKALLEAAGTRGGGPPTIGKPLPATEEAIALNPDLKVLVILGRYDGESTCPANSEVERNLPAPLKRAITFRCYDAGHSPWRTPGVLQQFSDDVKAMIRAGS